jgi:hypothetical protein
MIPSEWLNLDNGNELRLGGSWHGGHGRVRLRSIGVVEWARIVFTEPGVLEGMRMVDVVGL